MEWKIEMRKRAKVCKMARIQDIPNTSVIFYFMYKFIPIIIIVILIVIIILQILFYKLEKNKAEREIRIIF